MTPRVLELTAGVKLESTRIDQYLAVQYPDYSRSVIKKVIDDGGVVVNGKPVKASYKVRSGDHVKITLPDPTHDAPQPEDIPLDVLYEDDDFAIINKPPDMVVHPAKGHWSGTLANAVQFRFGQLSMINGAYRPGIVHRLDRDTSGAILIAKDEQAHRDLGMQFEMRKVFKEYLALTAGEIDRDSDYIERRIGHHPRDRIKMIVTDDEARGKEACSFYEVIERFRGFSFVRIQPRTGRTHQIRVHLASIGCPVLADEIYAGRTSFKLSEVVPGIDPIDDELLLERQALHAARLRIIHPRTKEVVAVEAPLPADFQRALDMLRKHRKK